MQFSDVINLVHQRLKRLIANRQIRHVARQVSQHAVTDPPRKPVIIFNASTRLVGMSLNAAYALLTSWALRLQGVHVVQFTCQAGMSHCVLGTSRLDLSQPPNCKACMAQSRWLYTGADISPFIYQLDRHLQAALEGLTLAELQEFTYPSNKEETYSTSASFRDLPVPLGQLVLPSVRWVLRRQTLQDDASTRFLLTEYILSAYNVAIEFSNLLEKVDPQAVVVFNGQFFPEATVRWICQQRDIRNITHEVGLLPFSAFFTTGEATAYPLVVPDDFELDDQQNKRLDAYLDQRFQGKFTMAGVRFWSDMKGVDGSLKARIQAFKHVVPVFTNVIFDTSQPHSNVLFSDMFAWLDLIIQVAFTHPDIMFIIRAHPDEDRPGKQSRESVQGWAERRGIDQLQNVIFVDAAQPLSSYALIQQAKFVMVYNSTIGLEASLMGAPVLCAGRSRYTQLPTVFFPATQPEYLLKLEELLNSETISVPASLKKNSRRFLYYQLYRSSLPFEAYLQEDGIWPGFVRLRRFALSQLSPATSPTIRTILAGILENGNFLLDADI